MPALPGASPGLPLLGRQGQGRACTRWANSWHPPRENRAPRCGAEQRCPCAQQGGLFHRDELWAHPPPEKHDGTRKSR